MKRGREGGEIGQGTYEHCKSMAAAETPMSPVSASDALVHVDTRGQVFDSARWSEKSRRSASPDFTWHPLLHPHPQQMAPSQIVLLSPAELSFLQVSLSQQPPIRADGRSPNQFRPLVAETDILPAANGSARVCFADGTEAVVGVKAEVEKTTVSDRLAFGETNQEGLRHLGTTGGDDDVDMDRDASQHISGPRQVSDAWLQVGVEIPGYRDDDQMPVFLASMLSEALLADGNLRQRLYINTRFHWVLSVDVRRQWRIRVSHNANSRQILLLSAPLSYPLPLLSLTTHLAMLQTRFPALISEKEEDPLYNDDWDAAVPLYPSDAAQAVFKPPITLLVIAVGDNVFFDPGQDELAVADAVLAVSVVETKSSGSADGILSVIAMRSIDPPSHFTNPGVPNSMNPAAGGTAPSSSDDAFAIREKIDRQQIWRPPRGGMRRSLIGRMTKATVEKGGVGWEVIEALEAVER